MDGRSPLPQQVRDQLARQAAHAGAALVLGIASYLLIWILAGNRPSPLVTVGVALVAVLSAVMLCFTLGQYLVAKRRAAQTGR